jgi:ATP-dependent Lon protease
VIDKISVALNDKADVCEAEFANLGIKKVLVDSGTVKAHPKLLVSGVWCIAEVEYEFTEERNTCPWVLSSLKPIQLSHFDFDVYARQEDGSVPMNGLTCSYKASGSILSSSAKEASSVSSYG